MSEHPLLEISGLRAGYGRATVLRGIDVTVQRGEAIALLGPNGHGKTTMLNAVSGLIRPMAGAIRFQDEDIVRRDPTEIFRRGLVHIPQGSLLFPRLTVQENVLLGSRRPEARAHRSETLELVQALFPKLQQRRDQLVGTLSGGERQMVAIAMGLMARPELLVLDEPTLGLAPKVRGEILAALKQVQRTGLTLLVADGDIDFLFELTDRWYLIELGRVVGSGSADQRPSQQEVMDMYVGGTHPTASSTPAGSNG
ncbi:ABC transporter ATP-binding protein [Pseudoclavibacter sp. RFBA6]|uniref:ABC transporter ATP-binding protein n=1 Tax=Pseudoclavibacter sp. RFBA6 TaxID=2080573 RepID=UPI000CE896B2|nr:ABC transporter ATP-binding protein [Pseudoclavibacter sp. RFBA6]PPG38120.1 ABC transporter ATP-binding protein [Pseudoclavibacter sp. RFBA6]